jgi:hypothetical protein
MRTGVRLADLVRPEAGPTLPDLLRPLPRVARAAVWGGLAAIVLVLAWLALGGADPAEEEIVVRGERTFNLAHGGTFERVAAPGALLALQRRREDGLFLDGFTVRPLTLPPYRGAASGTLPLVGGERLAALERRLEGFRPANPVEGRTRVNAAPGYQLTYALRRDGRTIYARDILLVPDAPGERRGVLLELRTTPAAGTPNAARVGATGALRLPLRSFRFGTERDEP